MDDYILKNEIRRLMSEEFIAIQSYSDMIAMVNNENSENKELIAQVLNSIIDEEKVHAGELQKLLELLDPKEAQLAKKGKEEVEELKFASKKEAIQYLANISGNRIKIATENIDRFKGIFSIDGKKINLERIGSFQLSEVTEEGFIKPLTWKEFKESNLPLKEQEERQKDFVQALLRQEKQFNKKVDFNGFCQKNNPSFEEKVDYLLKNTKARYTRKGIKS